MRGLAAAVATLLLLLVWAPLAEASEPGSASKLTPFASTLSRAAGEDDFVGLAVAVVNRQGPLLVRTYGVTDITADQSVQPDTVFRVASLSKGFAGTLAGISVAEGELSLNAAVDPLVPQFELISRRQESALTVEHILSHRVGLPPNAYDNLLEANVDPAEILARYSGVEMICGVGQCYAYQNVAFNMITSVLEQVAEQDFAALLEQRLFTPLAMQHASLGRDALLASSSWARAPCASDPDPVGASGGQAVLLQPAGRQWHQRQHRRHGHLAAGPAGCLS